MKYDQAGQTRRTLKQMNDAAIEAIDRQAGRSRFAQSDQLSETRRVLREMNDAADGAIDQQIAHSTPMTPKEIVCCETQPASLVAPWSGFASIAAVVAQSC
jgi:hypothetical protein